MRNTLFGLFILLTMGTYSAKAQSLRIGPRFGMNYSNVSRSVFRPTTSISTTSGIWRPMYGLVVQQEFNQKIALQAEVLYSHQGEYQPSVYPLMNWNTNQREINFHYTDYLQLPLLLTLKTMGTGGRGFLNLGFFGAWRLQDSWKDKASPLAIQAAPDSMLPVVRQKDAGIVIGAGAEAGRKNNRFIFELRYTRGIYSLYPTANSKPIQTRLVSVSMAYLIGFGKPAPPVKSANPRYTEQ